MSEITSNSSPATSSPSLTSQSAAPITQDPPKPGWKTSEAWVTFLTMLIGTIPSSGLTADAPLLAKVVGMAIAALAAMHYTAQRTSLKRAFTLPARSLSILLVVGLLGSQTACSGGLNCQDTTGARAAGCAIVEDVVDCTVVNSLDTGAAFVADTVNKLIQGARQSDGSIQWSAIEPQLVDLALQYGGCVFTKAWDSVARGIGLRVPVTRESIAPPADFSREFEQIRSKTTPGRKFKVDGTSR